MAIMEDVFLEEYVDGIAHEADGGGGQWSDRRVVFGDI